MAAAYIRQQLRQAQRAPIAIPGPISIQISNRARLERFVNDLNTNYNHNDIHPEYIEIKTAHIATLIDRLREPRETFGGLIKTAYNDIWGIDNQWNPIQGRRQYNNKRHISGVHNHLPGGIEIINTTTNARIKVASYDGWPNVPKGETQYLQDQDPRQPNPQAAQENSLDAARRELREETGIDYEVFPELNRQPDNIFNEPTIGTVRFLKHVYRVSDQTYNALRDIMIAHAEDVPDVYGENQVVDPDRSADVTTIYYNKYMKYKAKYLALVKSMGK
jgi:8-oxo-dGTP pyrophosphatase MutT (NUDIX family)